MNQTTDFNYFNTLLVHSVGEKVGPIAPTITPSAAYGTAKWKATPLTSSSRSPD